MIPTGAHRFVAPLSIIVIFGCADSTTLSPHDASPVDEGICDPDELEERLHDSRPGDVVWIGACEIEGSFSVPSGVILRGHGPAETLLISAGEMPAITMEPGESPTSVSDLSMIVDGCVGVLATGDGIVHLENVGVQLSRGIGLVFHALDELELDRVTVAGPVTVENAVEIPNSPSRAHTATLGLVVIDSESVNLVDVMVRGIAGAGAMLSRSHTIWVGGGAPDNLGIGLVVQGGVAQLEELELSRTMEGLWLIPSHAALFYDDAQIESEALEVNENEGQGIIQHSGTASHRNLVAHNNDDVAILASELEHLELFGEGTELIGNGAVSLFVVDSHDVSFRDALIAETLLRQRITSEIGVTEFGDGIHMLRPTGSIRLVDLELNDNGRIGLLVDLGERSTDDISVENVRVSGSGEQYGAVFQGHDIMYGFGGVVRDNNTLGNDFSLEEPLPTLNLSGSTTWTWDNVTLDPDELASIFSEC